MATLHLLLGCIPVANLAHRRRRPEHICGKIISKTVVITIDIMRMLVPL